MNKYLSWAIVVIVIVLAVVLFILSMNDRANKTGIFATPSPTIPVNRSGITRNQTTVPPTIVQAKTCTKDQLQPAVSFEGAAGSVYGTFSIKNISSTSCSIPKSYISLNYDTSTTTNLNIEHSGTGAQTSLIIQPQKAVTAILRAQNGPQCSGPVVQVPVTYSFVISQTETVSFTDQNSSTQFELQACQDPSEQTLVEVAPFSSP